MYAIRMGVTLNERSSMDRVSTHTASGRMRRRSPGVVEPSRRIVPHLATLLVIAAVAVALLSAVSRPEAPQADVWATVSVGPNTTIWELATLHPIPGLDTAGTVAAIRAENALTSSVIHVGQIISVPASVADTVAYAQR